MKSYEGNLYCVGKFTRWEIEYSDWIKLGTGYVSIGKTEGNSVCVTVDNQMLTARDLRIFAKNFIAMAEVLEEKYGN